jgi:TPR repeat protein
MRFLLVILALLFFISNTSYGQKLEAVQIYTDTQLLGLIKENKHLGQVVLDECQLVQDIEARATKSEYPSYQFLWGDMLAYGVCVKKDVPLGLHFMKNAADQALPEALEQLGRYYHTGKFIQVDVEKAMFYLREAAAVNNLKAQIRLADIYAQGYGSPLDYPELYTQLHHSVTDDKKIHQQIAKILSVLADKMPEHVVNSAKEGKF